MRKLNMKNNLKSQQGYLIILLIAIIVILSFIGVILVYMFTINTTSTTNTFQADKSFYIAVSGLEKAKRDIIVNGLNCDNTSAGLTSSKYTNQSLYNGQYTITAAANKASTKLSASINNTTAKTISLQNASQLSSPSGIITIDSEIIYYPTINGNTLQKVTRGAAGSIAATHSFNTTVMQNQCLLNAVGASPTIAAPDGERIIKQLLNGRPLSIGGLTPTLIGANTVTISKNTYGAATVINPTVTPNSPNFNGSTIDSASTISFSSNAYTEVNSSSGLIHSSYQNNIVGDVMQHDANITSSNLFGLIFNQPKAAVKSNANVLSLGPLSRLSSLNGITGKTIWVNGSITISSLSGPSYVTVGSSTSPVTLIVDGSIDLAGENALVVYGLLYVTGHVNTNAIIGSKYRGGLSVYGTLAAENNITLQDASLIQYDTTILLLPLPSILKNNYLSTISISQEIFN